MIRVVVAPLLGGIIGYITNDLAIKMLFRPRVAVYIGKWHIPFTPGLIPKQKERIAGSLGRVISSQLLNEETLRQTLLSEKTLAVLQGKIRELLHSFSKEDRTVRQMLEKTADPETLDEKSRQIQEKLTEMLVRKVTEAKLGAVIAEAGLEALQEWEGFSKLSFFFFDESLLQGIKGKMAGMIDDVIAAKAPSVIEKEIGKAADNIMETRVSDLYSRYQDKEDLIVDYIVNLYKNLLGNNLGKLLDAVNIQQIVVDKINSFDAAELENMIFGIMKRELNAIVYLGAMLGFLMGFINLLF